MVLRMGMQGMDHQRLPLAWVPNQTSGSRASRLGTASATEPPAGGPILPPARSNNNASPTHTNGSVTERWRGRHGSRPKPYMTSGTQQSLTDVGAYMPPPSRGALVTNSNVDDMLNMGLATEAHVSRMFAEMQQSDFDEISRLAVNLRKEFDALRLTVKTRTAELDMVQDQLSRLDFVQAGKNDDESKIQLDAEEVQRRLTDAKAAYEDALYTRDMYAFMADRLKDQCTNLDLEITTLQASVANCNHAAEEARLDLHHAKQERSQMETKLAILQNQLDTGREKRASKLASLDLTLEEQESKRKAIQEREHKRREIARLAQGDLNEEEEDRLKQLFLVRKVFSNMLVHKLQDIDRKVDTLQEAFHRIRSATGLQSVDHIVEKFLDRDATVEALRMQMAEARKRIEDLQQRNAELRQQCDNQELSDSVQLEQRDMYNKVEAYDRRLADAKRLCDEAKQRSFKITITVEESRACISKLLNKLRLDTEQFRQVSSGRRSAGTSRLTSVDHTEAPAVTVDSMAAAGQLVPADLLAQAVAEVDVKLTTYFNLVAAIFEKEEQKASSKNRVKGEKHLIRRLSAGSAREVMAAVAGGGNLSSITPRSPTGAITTDAAQHSTMSMLASKASDRVYQNMMNLQLDTSPTNVRIKPRRPRNKGLRETGSDEEEQPFTAADFADLGEDGQGLQGADGGVVERQNLKRLSNMLRDKKVRKRGIASRRGRSPRGEEQ